MCSLCARELSNRRKDSEGGGLTDNSSSFSFSLLQPAFDLVVYPPLCRLQCERKERSCFWCHTQSSWLLFVNATMIFPQLLSHCLLSLIRLCPPAGSAFHVGLQLYFIIIFGKSYSTGKTSLSSSTPTAHT